MKIASHKQAFGAVAKEYKKWRGGYDKRLYDLLLSLPGKKVGLAILDVGCGVGNSTEPVFELARKRGIPVDMVGVEPDGRMLVEARKSAKALKLPIVYVEAPAEKIPLTSETFDLAYSGAAFHWFATKKALNSIKRVLKPGGVFFGSTLPGGGVEDGETDEQALIREAMEEVGARIDIIEPIGEVVAYRDFLKKKYVLHGYLCKQIGELERPTSIDPDEQGTKIHWLDINEAIQKLEAEIDTLMAQNLCLFKTILPNGGFIIGRYLFLS